MIKQLNIWNIVSDINYLQQKLSQLYRFSMKLSNSVGGLCTIHTHIHRYIDT